MRKKRAWLLRPAVLQAARQSLARDSEGDVQPWPASGGDRASTRTRGRLFVELGPAGARSPLANLETSRISWRPRHAGAGAEAGREAGRVGEGLVGDNQGQVDRACWEGYWGGVGGCCGPWARKGKAWYTKLANLQESLANGRAAGGQEGREGAARRTEAHRYRVGGQKGNRDRSRVGRIN